MLLALGIIGVLYGISHAGVGLADPLTWAPLAVGLVLLAAFALVELRGGHPFYPLRLFANPGFIAAVTMGLAFNFAQAVSILQMANIWQFVYGFHTIEVSLGQLPLTVVSVIGSILIGRFLTRGMSSATAVAITGGRDGRRVRLAGPRARVRLVLGVRAGTRADRVRRGRSRPLRGADPPARAEGSVRRRHVLAHDDRSDRLRDRPLGSMVLIDALTHGGILRRLQEAGVPPTRTGEALDAISQYTQKGTVPPGTEGQALLAGAASAYEASFVTTMLVSAAIVAVLSAVSIVTYRRWARSVPA